MKPFSFHTALILISDSLDSGGFSASNCKRKMSSSISSLRLFTTKIPICCQPSRSLISPRKPTNLIFLKRAISFQKIPAKRPPPPQSSPSSSPPSSSTQLQSIDELPPKLQEIVKLFQSVQEPKAKYEQLLFYGKNLKPLDAHFKTRENKVEGCVSQVWVRAYLDKDKNVVYEADSDSVLTKGLAALLVSGLSGRPVEEILRVSPDFAVLLGLQQSLTPSRNNGFLNMLKLMQRKALQLVVEAEKGGGSSISELNYGEDRGSGLSSEMGSSETLTGRSTVGGDAEALSAGLDSPVGSGEGLGGRGVRIKEKLERELSPVELEVEDISYQHAGHAGVRGSDGETHFNVRIVSKEFEGKSLIKRHRLIYDLLQEELQSGLHALSIVAKTPSEVHAR